MAKMAVTFRYPIRHRHQSSTHAVGRYQNSLQLEADLYTSMNARTGLEGMDSTVAAQHFEVPRARASVYTMHAAGHEFLPLTSMDSIAFQFDAAACCAFHVKALPNWRVPTPVSRSVAACGTCLLWRSGQT